MQTGLISVTFRSKSRAEICGLASEAGLDFVMWGGDIHVPHGDINAALDARALSDVAGLGHSVYGSYYRLPDGSEGFCDVLDTARALGSDSIRIWAGTKGSSDVSDDERRALVATAIRDAELAAGYGIGLQFEFHGGTLTDTPESAKRLIYEIGCDNVRLHWQPNQFRDFDYNLSGLRSVAGLVTCAHVFAWEGSEKLPLSRHAAEWSAYFDILASAGCGYAAMEFVPVECRDDLLRDAETLKNLLKGR